MVLACKSCHTIVPRGHICQACKETVLSKDWSGYVIILDPDNSEIAKRLKLKKDGRYALRVR